MSLTNAKFLPITSTDTNTGLCMGTEDLILTSSSDLYISRIMIVKTEDVLLSQLAKDMTEVPKTTLYRHINVLEQAGVISVVDERKVRGTIEKTFAIDMDAIESDKDEEVVLNNAF